MTMTLSLAAMLTAAGVLALRLAWHWRRRPGPGRQLVLRWIGWLLLAIALVPWVRAGGQDRGIALAVGVFMLVGLALALIEGWRAWQAPTRQKRRREPRNDPPATSSRGAGLWLRRAWIFCLAGPVALASALTIGLALWLGLAQAGVDAANVLAVAMLSVPVIWAVFTILGTMGGGLGRRALLVILPGLVGLGATLALAGGAT